MSASTSGHETSFSSSCLDFYTVLESVGQKKPSKFYSNAFACEVEHI
jgi:hypothetical protein